MKHVIKPNLFYVKFHVTLLLHLLICFLLYLSFTCAGRGTSIGMPSVFRFCVTNFQHMRRFVLYAHVTSDLVTPLFLVFF